MPRGERPLEGDFGVLIAFATDLRQLRRRAGRPTYRELAMLAHYSAASLSEAASGRKLPSLPVTLAYVRACRGDIESWERRWHNVACHLAAGQDSTHANAGDDQAPYVGLAAFQRQDAPRFHGREREVDDVRDRLSKGRFVALFGASGAGKSSLLRAGLIPALENTGKSMAVLFNPGSRPLEEFAISLAAVARVGPGQLLSELTTEPRTIHRIARQVLAESAHDRDLVLVVDQFEEIFTRCANEDERRQFVRTLLAATAEDNTRCRVVLGVRADCYAHCTRYPDLVEAWRDNQVTVGPMRGEELRHAITRPAQQAGCMVEGALLARLIAEAKDEPGVLPLLSHALLETWRRRRGNTLSLSGYHASGGIDGALRQTAESTYTALPAPGRLLARNVFLRLTALGEGTEDTKRRASREELDWAGPGVTELLDHLARARLIILDRGNVEIAHEALIRSWPRLRDWLAEDREGLRLHRHLTESAQAWQVLGEDPGGLYRGARLAMATAWASEHDTALTSGERRFLQISARTAADERTAARRQTRRLRVLVALLCALSAAAIVALHGRARATWQRDQALSQQGRRAGRHGAHRAPRAVRATQPGGLPAGPHVGGAKRLARHVVRRPAHRSRPGGGHRGVQPGQPVARHRGRRHGTALGPD